MFIFMKKFLLLFISLIVVFLAGNSSVFAENIKFVQITDAHIDSNSAYSQNVLKSAVEDINALEGVSFVVFTGDNINSPSPENLKAFVTIVEKLKAPYYVALGNHDVYKSQGMSRVRDYEILKRGKLLVPQRGANYGGKKKGFVVLGVEGAKGVIPGSMGYYRE